MAEGMGLPCHHWLLTAVPLRHPCTTRTSCQAPANPTDPRVMLTAHDGWETFPAQVSRILLLEPFSIHDREGGTKLRS